MAQSWDSGGTSGALPAERARASFDTAAMTALLYGGEERAKKRRFILAPGKRFNPGVGHKSGDLAKYSMTREELMRAHFRDFVGIHKPFTMKGYQPEADEVMWMSMSPMNTGSFMPHFSLFCATLLGQCSPAQMMRWLPKALRFEIIGGYAQTELGHGSNVRGLQTVAEYDAATEEFVLSTPTLQSMKWWNSNLGLAATHCVLYAQLIIAGEEKGVHCFFVQVRDEDHRPLPGVELGDCGTKLGDNAIDTGYVRLQGVRIPREHMLAKKAHVAADGAYVRAGRKGAPDPATEKLQYLTMMTARVGMIGIAAGRLASAATIAVRYSCVRRQGFADAREGASFRSAEVPIIDYQVQGYRLLTQVATAYAVLFTGRWINARFATLRSELMSRKDGAGEDIPEIHATSAGLKGLCCTLAGDGIEDLRKCCGGHGYLLSSGVAALGADFVWQVTAEGDPVVMQLQTARFLVKALAAAREGKRPVGSADYLAGADSAAAAPPPAGAAAFRDVAALRALFRARALRAVVAADAQLRAKQRAGADPTAAWNACHRLLLRAGERHCWNFLLGKFADVVAGVEAPAVRAVLERLVCLFALGQVVDGSGWAGVVGEEGMVAAEDALRDVLAELRPDAVALVDAFDIPDRVLGSALGREDGNVYEALYHQAKNNPLNQHETCPGYEEYLRPHLDRKFLALRNGVTPGLRAKKKKAVAKL